jgi:spore photoproduct lyase
MYRSANYLLFVNYEEFWEDIQLLAKTHADDEKSAWFFSGYDCDSLAFEPVSQFAQYIVPKFKDIPGAVLELRTKSTQVRSLLEMDVVSNVVVAYSLSPEPVVAAVEEGAPTLAKRLDALVKLQNKGWRLGIRFDPIIWHQDYQKNYREMLAQVFTALDVNAIDSVTIGGFRLPKGFYKIMRKLHPEHWLFSAGLSESEGMIAYTQEIETQMFEFMLDQTRQYVAEEKVYAYPSYPLPTTPE